MCATKRAGVSQEKGRRAIQKAGDLTQRRGQRHCQLARKQVWDAGKNFWAVVLENSQGRWIERARGPGGQFQEKDKVNLVSDVFENSWEERNTSGGEFTDGLVAGTQNSKQTKLQREREREREETRREERRKRRQDKMNKLLTPRRKKLYKQRETNHRTLQRSAVNKI